MSCPIESDLNRHMQKLDEQAADEKHMEENPNYSYLIRAYKFEAKLEWEEYAYSEEEKNEHIAAAKETGLIHTCKKEIVELNY